MRILLDCRPLQDRGADSDISRLILSFAALPAAGGSVEWLYLVDQRYRRGGFPDLPLPGPSLLIRRAFPGGLGWKWWYKRQVPRLARKYKVDGVMMTGGVAAGALAVPQYIWMPGGSVIRREAGAEDKMVHVRPEPTATPLSPAEREAAKAEWAGGKEYFLVISDGAGQKGMVNLLKAFSLFKKRQRSNMQLVILDRDPPSGRVWQEKLNTYKYREDLHWVVRQEGLQKVIGGAYALLMPFAGDGLGVPVLNAWKAGVPVIAGPGGGLAEIGGEAVLYASPDDPAVLAGQMMLIYKDEACRNSLIEKGRDRLYFFREDFPEIAVWKVLQKIN